MKSNKTPGVYVEEISNLLPSVSQVATAVPAFIGYTERAQKDSPGDLLFKPTKITSLLDYEKFFGKADSESFNVYLNEDTINKNFAIKIERNSDKTFFTMYHALQLYFSNGGTMCYIVSSGIYSDNIEEGNAEALKGLIGGLAAIEKEDEPTILIIPDVVSLSPNHYRDVYEVALTQCSNLRDRVTIVDLHEDTGDIIKDAENFRNLMMMGSEFLIYGAAYYPRLTTSLKFSYKESKVTIKSHLDQNGNTPSDDLTGQILDSIEIKKKYDLYDQITFELNNSDSMHIILPPSSAVAGVYARTDAERGVWKAPANVSLNSVIKPTVSITDSQQEILNIDPAGGKSINAIRSFVGKGILVWGARTLAGNDNEWRYISVRRFFNMIEESCKKATVPFVFEPNEINTWEKIQAMLENYLTTLWKQGALQGAKPEHAFYVAVGLGRTMTQQDILEGRMIIEIGMAVVRPAEFIVLRFLQKMQEP